MRDWRLLTQKEELKMLKRKQKREDGKKRYTTYYHHLSVVWYSEIKKRVTTHKACTHECLNEMRTP